MHSHPLGLAASRPPDDGIAPYGGAIRPGSLGIGTDPQHSPVASEAPAATTAADLSGASPVSFVVGSEHYRLCRTDSDWRKRPDELNVPPDRAAAILERAATMQPANSPLLRLFQSALASLAGVQTNGVFVLLWQRPQPQERAPVPPPPPIARPRTAASSSPAPAPQAQVVDAQAAALKQAAQSGAPFCEECAKAAAAGA